MAGTHTLTIIKPLAVKENNAGNIIAMILRSGFKIIAMKQLTLTQKMAGEFYAIHKERPFYQGLINSMMAGPVIVAILEKDNAVEDYRRLMGATDPAKASDGTIRKLYGVAIQENAVHGSDSDENAIIESNFFFSQIERF